MNLRAVIALALLPALAHAAAPAPSAEGLKFFESKIRPVLAEHCYQCHSAQSEKVKGQLLLDTRAGVLKGGESGQPAVVPGDAEKSLLIEAIRWKNKDLEMPPKAKLSAAQIADFVAWVNRGAPDPRAGKSAEVAKKRVIDLEAGKKYWAFQPLAKVAEPKVKNTAWAQTPIDRFILAQLEAKKLAPNAPAERRKLIRRAYFDLIGLPPTPAEIEAFLNDTSPTAWGQVVDHLLASPHYGERWGRHWLDVARFGESHGFEQDYDRPHAYHYRDFVIKALNADLPYTQFIRWQLAGDEIEPDNPLALMATGFMGGGVFPTQITANEVEKSRYDALDDMAQTTGAAMLGLSIGCARCHDHKFDPIPTRDYYRFISTFTTTVRSDIDLDLEPEIFQAAKAKFEAEHAPFADALGRFELEKLPGLFAEWEKSGARPAAPQWLVLNFSETKSKGGATFTNLADGSVLATGTNPKTDTFTFVAHTFAKGITAVRLEALAHASLVKSGPGRAANGNFALSDFTVTAAGGGGLDKAMPVKLVNAKATFEQKGLPVAAAIDEDKKSAWAIDPQFGKDHAAVFEFAEPVGFHRGTTLTFTLDFQNNDSHAIARPRLSLSTAPLPALLAGESGSQKLVAEMNAALDTPAAQRTEVQRATLMRWFRSTVPEWQKLNTAALAHAKQEPQPKLTKVMVTSEGLKAIRHHTQGGDFLNATHLLQRGDPAKKQEVMEQGFLQVLMRAPEQEKHWQTAPPAGWRTSYHRLALANWITDPEQGAGALLARVAVNRLWHHHFGRGLVATTMDFGAQGVPPSHPELLEWLASELQRGGWKLKPLHKLMLLSATYQEDSRSDAAKAKFDPENTLQWHHTRRRLEAEVIRDNLLATSGVLEDKMFGAGTLDERNNRRSVYFMVKRSRLIPMLQLFDAPQSITSLGERVTTTTAPQALFFVNNPLARDYALSFSKRLAAAAAKSPADAVQQAHLLAFGRPATAAEVKDSVAFLEQQAAAYQKDHKANAQALALADFCQVLQGSNEFVYVE